MSINAVGNENLPNVYIRRISLFDGVKNGTGNFIASIELSVKDFQTNSGFYWSDDKFIMNNLSIMVMMSYSNSLTQEISSGKMGIDPRRISGYSSKDYDYTTIPIKLKKKQKLKINETTSLYTYKFKTAFKIKNASPSATVFAGAFIDFPNISKSMGGEPAPLEVSYFGPIASDSIPIAAGLQPEATMFVTKAGAPYVGPVHSHNGVYMAGSRHVSTPHESLEIMRVKGSKVEDFRGLADRLHKENNKLRTDLFFSPLWMTLDQRNFSRSMFVLNLEKIFLTRTRFGYLIQKTDPDAFNRLLQDFSIKTMSVYRRKIMPSLGKTKAGTRKLNRKSTRKIIELCFSKDIDGIFKNTIRFKNRAPRGADQYYDVPIKNVNFESKKFNLRNKTFPFSKYKMVSTISEVEFSSLRSPRHRGFVITDHSFASKRDSYYQYYLKLILKDNTEKYVTNKLKNINLDIIRLEKYVKDATNIRNYDFEENRVKPSFVATVDPAIWKNIAGNYQSHFSQLYVSSNTGAPGEGKGGIGLDRLLSYIDPTSLTIRSAEKFVNKYKALYSDVASYFGLKRNTFFVTNYDAKQKIYHKPTLPDIEIKHDFAAVLNFADVDYGYDYHSEPRVDMRHLSGLFTYDSGEFDFRVIQEEEKFFDGPLVLDKHQLKDMRKQNREGLLDVVSHKTTYMTPQKIVTPKKPIRLVKKNSIPHKPIMDLRAMMPRIMTPINKKAAILKPTRVNRNIIGSLNSPFSIKLPKKLKFTIKSVKEKDIDFVESADYLGDDSPFSSVIETKKEKNFDLKRIPIHKNLLLAQFKRKKMKKSFRFNLAAPKNIFTRKKLKPAKLKRIPFQIKSLMASAQIVKEELDVLALPENAPTMDMTYFALQRIEILDEFASGLNGTQDTSNPVWAPLTQDLYERHQISSPDAPMLCRMVSFKDPSIDVDLEEDYNLNVFNDYFFVTPTIRNKRVPDSEVSPNSASPFGGAAPPTVTVQDLDGPELLEYTTTNIMAQSPIRDGINRKFDYSRSLSAANASMAVTASPQGPLPPQPSVPVDAAPATTTSGPSTPTGGGGMGGSSGGY